MDKILLNLLVCWILSKNLRKDVRRRIKNLIYGKEVLKNAKSIGKNFVCNLKSNVNKNTVIGDYVRMNGVKVTGSGNINIGNYCRFGQEIMIIAQNHNYNGEMLPYDDTYIYKDIVIGDFVWIGSRVTILPGTRIGDGVIIQAGAVVHGDITPCAIVGGNPAKVFKYRDIEKFNQLKADGKFHTNI